MTHAVRYTSLKGNTAGQLVSETYETKADADFAASVMRAGGHADAVSVPGPDQTFFIVDGTIEKTVYGSVRAKAEGMCDLMNELNHKAGGVFGGGRYYVTREADDQYLAA